MNTVKHNSCLSSLVPRPSHSSVCRLQYLCVLQVTNAGVRRPGNEAIVYLVVTGEETTEIKTKMMQFY